MTKPATPAFERECRVAVEAAREAAHLIRSAVGRLRATDVREKGTSDLVTTVDEASEALLIRRLGNAFPRDIVLAEESASVTSDAANGRRWIIDPIDGTTNFAHGVPPYALSIALERADKVVLGIVLEVGSGDIYVAVRGHGAFLNSAPIRVSDSRHLNSSLVATGFPYRAFDHGTTYMDVLYRFMESTRGVRRYGAASVDLALVARGSFDGFFETGLMPWDVAAGMLLVEEAGGRVTDYSGRSGPIRERQIVASNGHVHDEMLRILAPMRSVRS